MDNKKKTDLWKNIDWKTTLIPLAGILILSILFMAMPEQSKLVLGVVRGFLGDELGFYYILIGLGTFLFSLYIAFSKYGSIRLGNTDKPQYSTFKWGTMIFTSTMAADILYYSLCEWALYAADPHIAEMGGLPVVPLGADSLELLHYPCDRVWFHAACKGQKETEVFRGMQTHSGKPGRRILGKSD